MQPIWLEDGSRYNNMPTVELTQDLVPVQDKKTFVQENKKQFVQFVQENIFVTPYERQIVLDGNLFPCSDSFVSKYKTTSDKWISISKHGIQQTTAPSTNMKWLQQECPKQN